MTKMKKMVVDLRIRKSTNTEVVYSTEPALFQQEVVVLQHMQLWMFRQSNSCGKFHPLLWSAGAQPSKGRVSEYTQQNIWVCGWFSVDFPEEFGGGEDTDQSVILDNASHPQQSEEQLQQQTPTSLLQRTRFLPVLADFSMPQPD